MDLLERLREQQRDFLDCCSLLSADSLRSEALLDQAQEELILRYLDLLIRWNGKMDLVSPAPAEVLLERHIIDSLAAGSIIRDVLSLSDADNYIDIGSGAGLPGVVMAVLEPQRPIVLCEPREKRAAFLKEVVRLLELKNVEVYHGRAESLSPEKTESREPLFSLAVSRALDSKSALLDIARGILKNDAMLAALVGPNWEQERDKAQGGLIMDKIVPYKLGRNGPSRKLVFWKCFT